jgi:hypothetical protein
MRIPCVCVLVLFFRVCVFVFEFESTMGITKVEKVPHKLVVYVVCFHVYSI